MFAVALRYAADQLWKKVSLPRKLYEKYKKKGLPDSQIADLLNRRPLPPMFLASPCFLLYGLALENLIKGAYLAKYPNDVRRLKEVWRNKGHDLEWLAKKAGIVGFQKEDSEMLHLLSETIVWRGRYPMSWKGYWNTSQALDLRRYGRLFERIRQELYSHVKFVGG
jgi:hypothetical protein